MKVWTSMAGLAALVVLVAGVGCSGGGDTDIVIAPQPTSNDAGEPAYLADTATPADAGGGGYTPLAIEEEKPLMEFADVDGSLAQADVALQQANYEQAVDALLQVQMAGAQMTRDQRINQVNRMRQVQDQIARAMATGDPNAQRAAQLLLQYNAARTAGGQ